MKLKTLLKVRRASRSNADRAAFRWAWSVHVGGSRWDTITSAWDDQNKFVVVERNGLLVGCYEGKRAAWSVSRAAKLAIAELYG